MVNVYVPNQHNEKLTLIKNSVPDPIAKTDITKLIITGDWNCTLTPKDKAGGLPWRETGYRNSIISLMKEFGLNDIYRKLHPNTRAFTYESKSLKVKLRIDYLFYLQPNDC